MARALAIETSGRVGSVATVRDGRVLEEISFEHGLAHAARMLPAIDQLCRAQQWRPADLSEVYLSIGPGSFTGLRIGVTLAKTLALATGVKLIAVPTLRVLVENAPPETEDCIIVLDAKRGQIFTARYQRIGNAWHEREPAHLDTLSAMLARAPRPIHLLGEGLPFHQHTIPPGDAEHLTDETHWRARAAAVAHLGHAQSRAGQSDDPMKLTPLYIRPPEAEEKRLSASAG